jgi:hypothetical protein
MLQALAVVRVAEDAAIRSLASGRARVILATTREVTIISMNIHIFSQRARPTIDPSASEQVPKVESGSSSLKSVPSSL